MARTIRPHRLAHAITEVSLQVDAKVVGLTKRLDNTYDLWTEEWLDWRGHLTKRWFAVVRPDGVLPQGARYCAMTIVPPESAAFVYELRPPASAL